MRSFKYVACGAVSVSVLMAAHAQSSSGVDEAKEPDAFVQKTITVTAQKRAQSIQDVPMSISAFGEAEIERTGITEFTDYATRIPNLSFAYTGSTTGGSQAIAIRGIAGNGTTGLYIDDTPLPESVDPRVMGIERIEVLRGPQGTLYGARSMGGTVRLITKQPDLDGFSGQVHGKAASISEGDFDLAADGALNIPLVENMLAVRAVGYGFSESGVYDRRASAGAPVDFGTNENVDGADTYGGQISALLSLAEGDLEITPRVMFQKSERDGRSLADVDAGNFVHSRLFDIDETANETWTLGSLSMRYGTEIGDFVSSTSLFDRSYDDSEDFSELSSLLFGVSPTPSRIYAEVEDERVSQEFRFESEFGGRTELTAGVFYQKADTRLEFPPTPVPGVSPDIFSQVLNTNVEELAVFGEVTFSVTDKLDLILGARWFDNEVDFNGSQDGLAVFPDTFAGVQKEKGTNPKVSVQYDIDDDRMVYATASKGFRIGGVNSFSNALCGADLNALGLTADQAQTYDSDSLWSYEAGVKSSFPGHRMTVNGAVFHIDWSDIQQRLPLGGCGFFVFANVGKAESNGLELELEFNPTNDLSIFLGAGYTDAKITDNGGFAAIQEGRRVQQVPEWTFTAQLDYEFYIGGRPGFFHGDYSYVGESESANNDATNRRIRQAYDLMNVRLGTTFGSSEVTLFVNNLFDEIGNLSDVPPLAIELPGRPRIAATRPRAIGIELRTRF
jgi:iron complex outermembrane receptor protein